MDKSEKYQKMADGTLEWVAAKAFIDDEMTQEERENLHMDWVLEAAIAKRFGENPNPRKEKVLRYLEQVKGIYTAKRNGEPQSEPLPDGKQENAERQAVVFPKELNNDKVKKIFDKAEQAEFISKNGSLYKWNKSNENTYQLLAYFCEKMSQFLNLGKTDANGNPTTSWKPFERLFGIDNIKGYKNDWLRINLTFNPVGYEKIDALFV